ncbi:MAG: hypothetical protein MRJ92_01485 [Nitrospira sp.]|nr:hypothetical protein [Nitrospira sp.]
MTCVGPPSAMPEFSSPLGKQHVFLPDDMPLQAKLKLNEGLLGLGEIRALLLLEGSEERVQPVMVLLDVTPSLCIDMPFSLL